MRSFLLAVCICLFASCSSGETKKTGVSPDAQSGVAAAVRAEVEKRLTWAGVPYRVQIANEPIQAEYLLPRFYKQRRYRSAWFESNGLSPRAQALLAAIRDSEGEGLAPEAFHYSALKTLSEDFDRRRHMKIDADLERQADFELLATDAFLVLGGQLQSGRVKPKVPGYEWYIPQSGDRDLIQVLEHALATAAIAENLESLLPKSAEYRRLRTAYGEYRKLAARGGWGLVTPGAALKAGMRDKRVLLVRKRLSATGDLSETNNAGEDQRLFDDALQQAVTRFQLRHGIKPDGIVGPGTLWAMNVSAPKRLRQIKANLERWRWLPRDMGARYVAVNIADFKMRVLEDDKTVFEMPVVVGTQYRHTPMFTGSMTHVILNPTWLVPHKIAVEDILPKIKKDPAYLEQNGFRVLEKRGKSWEEVDAQTIDWTTLTDESFAFRLEQKPGPLNALGRMKFMFPNKFGVYLHDTPAKDLFSKRTRTYSSGCIRLERPMELLSYLLPNEEVAARLESGELKKIDLEQPVRVHILYQTAWVEEDGTVHFRPDVYGKDELLDQFL